ncbi:MAG: cation transporter [Clostridia bacterium]|nr:cation transporter [Clostridia bacterium]
MTGLLIRLFVRDHQNTADPAVRLRYGTMVSVVSIICNLFLSAGKFAFGLLLGSIALTADGVNNLSDAGSAIVSLVSFRIAAKPADRDHPFGHARIEYVASMIVSFLVLLVGVELLTTSVDKILHPTAPDDRYLLASIILLSASILVKLWMGLLNRRVGKKIDSAVMRAAATDSLTDCISTLAVLVSTVLYATLSWDFLDGWFGLFVAILILVAGCRILNETKNSILGERPVEETVNAIRRVVGEYPEALGVHDLIVHDYGPGHVIASLHVEVDSKRDALETHDSIDNIERRICAELGIQCTIHTDPIVVGDPEVDRLHLAVAKIAGEIDERLRVHDFRFVRGTTHSNLIFDIAAPFECPLTDEEIKTAVTARVRAIDPHYCTVITLDRE